MNASRRTFLHASVGLPLSAPSALALPSQTASDFYLQLVKANDARLPSIIANVNAAQSRRTPVRRVASDVQALTAAFCARESSYFQAAELIAPLTKAAALFLSAQHPDGTIDSGNLQSPPDTGFVVETLGVALAVLQKNASPNLAPIKEQLKKFLLAAGEPLVTGGIHTPNHRWVMCSALSRLHSLFPNPRYVRRIEDWLGEGIDLDADGHFAERSTGIYSQVSDAAFIAMARFLARPELLEPVRKNLTMTMYFTHPNGDVETVGSRRQDQFLASSISRYYLEYRYLALRDRNAQFAGMVQLMENRPNASTELVGNLIFFLDEPLLREPLPNVELVPADYVRVFPRSAMARIRRNHISATIHGGSDWPLGVASGLASNPTFFTFRKGQAVLESVRMAANFFSKGHFRSTGLQTNGNSYVLQQRLEVPYYQPLAQRDRNARGQYQLSPAEDRFWSKLSFAKRQMSEVKTLHQKITITEANGTFALAFDITGHNDVPVTIELCFRAGGQLTGIRRGTNSFLAEGMGAYRAGGDVIEFGPGRAAHQFINLDGASYTAHRGSAKPTGECVYLTGYTPFRETITIR